MVDDGISARVKQLITEHVDSVMQLEVLLLLAGQGGQPVRGWTATELAQQLRVDAAWVDTTLRSMAATVNELAAAYADRRVTVIGLIFAKPTDKLRSFADAFRLRKDKSD